MGGQPSEFSFGSPYFGHAGRLLVSVNDFDPYPLAKYDIVFRYHAICTKHFLHFLLNTVLEQNSKRHSNPQDADNYSHGRNRLATQRLLQRYDSRSQKHVIIRRFPERVGVVLRHARVRLIITVPIC